MRCQPLQLLLTQCCCACAGAPQRDNKLGALAFGAELPNGKQAFPTSPSWMLYGGDDAHCLDNVPILIRPETFCSVFTAEARVFRCARPLLPPEHISLELCQRSQGFIMVSWCGCGVHGLCSLRVPRH